MPGAEPNPLDPSVRPGLPDWVKPGKGQPIPPPMTPSTSTYGPKLSDLAFYLPFHFYPDEQFTGVTHWGIYLNWPLFLDLISILSSTYADDHTHATSSSSRQILISLILKLLQKREHFRFQTEAACARRDPVMDMNGKSTYAKWFCNNTSLEHALCNAYAFNSVMKGQPPGISTLIQNLMLSEGPGYDRFLTFLEKLHFTAGKRLATHRMVDPTYVSGSWGYADHEPYEFLYHELWRTKCPVHYIV